jgi:preprotein translocase subunit SecG
VFTEGLTFCYNSEALAKGARIRMLDALLMIVSAMIVIITLLQGGKSNGISGAFTGNGGLNLFANVKERGSEKVVSNVTMILGIIFFVLVIAIRVTE